MWFITDEIMASILHVIVTASSTLSHWCEVHSDDEIRHVVYEYDELLHVVCVMVYMVVAAFITFLLG